MRVRRVHNRRAPPLPSARRRRRLLLQRRKTFLICRRAAFLIARQRSAQQIESFVAAASVGEMAKKNSPRFALSQPWFVYTNLALTIGAFALLYYYLPARLTQTTHSTYNSSSISEPKYRDDGEIWHDIRVVTDLDQSSRVADAKRPTWRSIMKSGTLKITADGESARVEWRDTEDVELRGEFALGGRVRLIICSCIIAYIF